MFLMPAKGDQPTHSTQPTSRWRTPGQQGAAAVKEDVSGGPEGGKYPSSRASTLSRLDCCSTSRISAHIGVSSGAVRSASSLALSTWPRRSAHQHPHHGGHPSGVRCRCTRRSIISSQRGGQCLPASAVSCTAGQGGKTNISIATTSGGLCYSVEALPVAGGASGTVAMAWSPVPAQPAYTQRSSIWPTSPQPKWPAQQHRQGPPAAGAHPSPLEQVALHSSPEQLALHTTPEQLALRSPPEQLALHSSTEQLALHSSLEQLALHSQPKQLALHSSPEQLALHSPPKQVD